MSNIIDVIDGDSLYFEIKKSNFIKNNKVVKFDISFSICDLSNIDNYTARLKDDYSDLIELMEKEIMHKPAKESSTKKQVIEIEEAIKNNNKIRIWTTHKEINAYIMLLYICNYFSNKDCDLYVLFSDELDEKFYSPSCMNERELEELSKLEHKLTNEEIQDYSNTWKQIIKTNSDMRIMENNNVKCVSFDYYNDTILELLKELGEVKTIKLVARLMANIYFSDIFLTYLIYRLIKKGKIIITKKENRLWKSTIAINDSSV